GYLQQIYGNCQVCWMNLCRETATKLNEYLCCSSKSCKNTTQSCGCSLSALKASSVWSHSVLFFSSANLTLNPDTAHSALLLSNDGKRVRLGDCITVLQSAQRFDKFECVLAREGFSSGRHYWEVEVNREFTIGVTRQSAQRKGKFTFCPSEGYWCLYHFRQVFTALDESTQRLQVDSVPRVLGVCIDVDEKWVIFYNTETKAQVYIFRNMAFTDGEKIYPLFNTLEKSVCLVIRTAR
uniref:B30.2/SPRY domain-containing protein n=1 Tax=Astyanax mexicanus TaxID=7994 RepID=A0A3B1JD59_ASTMX